MFLQFISQIKNKFQDKIMKYKFDEAPSLDQLEKSTIEEVQNARLNFNDADEETVDLAIYELMAAEERLSLLIKERKKKT